MYALEAISALTLLAFLVAQVSGRVDRRISIAAGAAGLVTIGLLFALRQARWQMAPLFLLWAVLSLSLLKRSPAHVVLRAIGAVLGLAVVGVGLVLSLGFPVVELPAPEGPYAVGSTAFTLVDDSRDESGFGAPEDRRELYVRLWYPASARSQDPSDGDRASRPLTLWHELYRGEQDLFTRMGSYLAGVDTSSYENAPLAADIDSVPVILFSHGMLGHAEQNTLLMEHLASHGYFVAAIGHSYLSMRVNLSGGRSVGAHLERFAAATGDRQDGDQPDLTRRLEGEENREERARLWMEHFENSTGLNALMRVWVGDLGVVADALSAPTPVVPGLEPFASRIASDRVGVMGMSFGGAAVAEFCKADERCAAGLNLDGGGYGSRQRQPLEIPYLALVSTADADMNAIAMRTSRSDFHQVVVAGAAHNDFLDATLVAPLLKWVGVNGAISGERMIEIMNDVALAFFDGYMRDGPRPHFDPAAFPELSIADNVRVGE